MQSKLFVFLGVPSGNSDADIRKLMERVHSIFIRHKIIAVFSLKEKLLSVRLDDVSFYISFLEINEDLEDWIELAANFELQFDGNPINYSGLCDRYEILENTMQDIYSPMHFDAARMIMSEMEKFKNIIIYSFQ